jgi:exportin-1
MCFVVALLQIPPAMFKLYVDSVIWGFKHTMRNVAEISLNILYTLMQKFSVCQDIASAGNFFKLYFLDLMQHVFAVVTDTSHTASLTMHATILAFMFQLVEEDKIPVPLYDQMTVPAANNALFVNEYVTQLIKQAFSHLTDAQIKVFIEGLFFLNKNILGFKEHLRDFLVQIKVCDIYILCVIVVVCYDDMCRNILVKIHLICIWRKENVSYWRNNRRNDRS